MAGKVVAVVNYSIGNNLGGLFHLSMYQENTLIRRKSVFDLDIFPAPTSTNTTLHYTYFTSLHDQS